MKSSVQSQCMFGRPEDPGTNRPACRDPLALFPDSMGVFGVPGPAALRPSARDSEVAISPLVGANLQLLTPRVDALPGGPRFFVTGELLTFWAPERDVSKEGSPTRVDFPDPAQSGSATQNALNFSERGLFGSGSRTRSEVQTLAWGARAGVAFPFNFRERRLWVKPSIGWMQFEVDVDGTVVAGLKDDGAVQDDGSVQFLDRGPGIRAVNLSASGSETFNGIGPGLEIEMDVGRFGPLGVSLYISGQAFKMIGETSIDLSDSVTCDSDTSPCLSGLVNDIEQITDVPIFPPIFPPPPLPQIEDIVSPAGPVPEVGVLYPLPAPGQDPRIPVLPHGPDTYTASWDFEVKDWGYRGGVGIRLHWLGR